MAKKNLYRSIVSAMKGKAVMKMEIDKSVQEVFDLLHSNVEALVNKLSTELHAAGKTVEVGVNRKTTMEFECVFAEDTLIFVKHSNIYTFDPSAVVMQSSYLQGKAHRAYYGIISVYNVLTDSVRYQRVNDSVALLARVYVNKEHHCMIEGERSLDMFSPNFEKNLINKQVAKKLVMLLIDKALDIDLIPTPMELVREFTVQELFDSSAFRAAGTGKQLGYKIVGQAKKLD